MALSPDRLSKGEGGSCRGGRIKAEEVPRNSPTVVIDDDGQPGLGDPTILSYQADSQLCMIGLPDRVWSRCFPSVNQVKDLTPYNSETLRQIIPKATPSDIHGSRMARDRTAMRLAESIRAHRFAGVLEYYGKGQPINYFDEETQEAAGQLASLY